jgi:hypothetical protein
MVVGSAFVGCVVVGNGSKGSFQLGATEFLYSGGIKNYE